MIFSVHIPKTAGTSFRRALEERFGDRLAVYYGVRDPKTTEGLRVGRNQLAEAAAGLRDRGFEVLHGHYRLGDVAPLLAEPDARVWTWLRDPVERVLSQFDFYKERPLELMRLAERVKTGELDPVSFARRKGVRDLQSRYLGGRALASLDFVGVTEQFELGLALLFGESAPELKRRYNATDGRSELRPAQRRKIAKANVGDTHLYAEGLRLFVERLAAASRIEAPARPEAAGAGVVRRLVRAAPGR